MFFLDMACLGTNEVSWIFSFARVNRNTETLMPYILVLFSACSFFAMIYGGFLMRWFGRMGGKMI